MQIPALLPRARSLERSRARLLLSVSSISSAAVGSLVTALDVKQLA